MSNVIMGNMVGGASPLKTLIIEDENSNMLTGVVTGSEVIFTATDNDVREGSVYASDSGVSTGTKFIPSYVVGEGYALITPNSTFTIKALETLDRYDYTKIQAILCPYNSSIAQSVAAEKVVIGDCVYVVNSTENIATVTKDVETKQINLGIINESKTLYLLRYFTYKEIY